MISMAACCRGSPGFKPRQGRVNYLQKEPSHPFSCRRQHTLASCSCFTAPALDHLILIPPWASGAVAPVIPVQTILYHKWVIHSDVERIDEALNRTLATSFLPSSNWCVRPHDHPGALRDRFSAFPVSSALSKFYNLLSFYYKTLSIMENVKCI